MSQHHHPIDISTNSVTKASLGAWWKQFTAKNAGVKKSIDGKGKSAQGIFGLDLAEAIEVASVPICMAGPDGRQYVYGYIPTIVAKCGMYLKEHATTTEGIFRLNGSAKRIRELQAIFDSPPSYGKTLTWVGYSVHDAANVLRRYLNHLKDPVIPQNRYEEFRSVFVNINDIHGRVVAYQRLLNTIPKENQHLLLYILDLLAVFSSKASQNLMPSKNLSSIFQPGILSHESHNMAPEQYKLSQEVLEFLIDYQNYFLMSLPMSASMPKVTQPTPAITRPTNDTTSKQTISTIPTIPGLHRTNTMMEPPNLNNPQPSRPSVRRSSFSMERNSNGEFEPTNSGLLVPGRSSTLIRSKTLPGSTTKRPHGHQQSAGEGGNESRPSRSHTTTSRLPKNQGSANSFLSTNTSKTGPINPGTKPAKLRKKMSRKMIQQQDKQERQHSRVSNRQDFGLQRRRSATHPSTRPSDESRPKKKASAPSLSLNPVGAIGSTSRASESNNNRQLSPSNSSDSYVIVENKENESISSSSTNSRRRKRSEEVTTKTGSIGRGKYAKEKTPFLLELRKRIGFGASGGESSGGEEKQRPKKIRHA